MQSNQYDSLAALFRKIHIALYHVYLQLDVHQLQHKMDEHVLQTGLTMLVQFLYHVQHISWLSLQTLQLNGVINTYPATTCIYDQSGAECPWCGIVTGVTTYSGAPGAVNWDYCSNCCSKLPHIML